MSADLGDIARGCLLPEFGDKSTCRPIRVIQVALLTPVVLCFASRAYSICKAVGRCPGWETPVVEADM